jgi:hypothetical protein
MQLFKITNPKYTGEIEVLYTNGTLLKFDFANAQITNDTKAAFKTKVPVTLEAFMQGSWCGKDTVVVAANYEVTLDDFKKEYPYKRNTHLLQPIWDKMQMSHKIQAVQEATKYSKYCKKNDWYKPMIAASWLNNKEYLNDWNKM